MDDGKAIIIEGDIASPLACQLPVKKITPTAAYKHFDDGVDGSSDGDDNDWTNVKVVRSKSCPTCVQGSKNIRQKRNIRDNVGAWDSNTIPYTLDRSLFSKYN